VSKHDYEYELIGLIAAGVSPLEISAKTGILPGYFRNQALGKIFAIALEISSKGRAPGFTTLCVELKNRGLGSLEGEVIKAYDLAPVGDKGAAESCALEIVRGHIRRELEIFGNSILQNAKRAPDIEAFVTNKSQELTALHKILRSAKPKQEYTVSQLLKLNLPAPTWLIPGLLTEGGITVLSGRPKTGKSWLALETAGSVATGTPLLGIEPAQPAPVVYYALEDSPRRLKSRLESMQAPETDNLELILEAPPLLTVGEEEITTKAKDRGAKLVVIDTLAMVRAPIRRGADAYAEDYAVMCALRRISQETGASILVVHHTRKAMAEDIIDAPLGTTGITGGADTVCVLRRDTASIGVLSIRSRDTRDVEYTLEWRDSKWIVSGTRADTDYRLPEAEAQIVDALSTGPKHYRKIAEELGKSEGAIAVALSRMVQRGIVQALGAGMYGLPTKGCYAPPVAYGDEFKNAPCLVCGNTQRRGLEGAWVCTVCHPAA
jgi:DNA-binding NarL/FixJ family response regulator